jgi:hypothetical protein
MLGCQLIGPSLVRSAWLPRSSSPYLAHDWYLRPADPFGEGGPRGSPLEHQQLRSPAVAVGGHDKAATLGAVLEAVFA